MSVADVYAQQIREAYHKGYYKYVEIDADYGFTKVCRMYVYPDMYHAQDEYKVLSAEYSADVGLGFPPVDSEAVKTVLADALADKIETLVTEALVADTARDALVNLSHTFRAKGGERVVVHNV
jgi:hypothetical protein